MALIVGSEFTNPQSAWARSYNREGAVNWTITEPAARHFFDAASDSLGNHVVVAVDSATNALIIRKLSASGGELWTTVEPGLSFVQASVAIDGADRIVVAATIVGDSLWLGQYDAGGGELQQRTLTVADAPTSVGVAVATDPSDNILVAAGRATERGWVGKLDADAQEMWIEDITSFVTTQPRDIAADGDGNIFVAGAGRQDPMQTSLANNAFWTKLTPQGSEVWTYSHGMPNSSDGGSSTVFRSDGTIIACAVHTLAGTPAEWSISVLAP